MLWWEDLKYKLDRIFNKKSYFEISGHETKLTPVEIDVLNNLYGSMESFNSKLKEIDVLRDELNKINHDLSWHLVYGIAATKENPLPSTALGKMERSLKANLKPLIDKLSNKIKEFELKINLLSGIVHDIEKLTNQKNTDLLEWLNDLVQIYKNSIRSYESNIDEAKQAISLN